MAHYDPVFYRQTMALQISLLILSTLSVFLRFLARYRKRARRKSDDFWALAALVSFFGYLSVGFYGLLNGGGLKPEEVPSSVFEEGLKAVYASGILTLCTITAAKISILMLYRRVFLCDPLFRTASNVMLVVCVMWWIASSLAFIFSCTPIQKNWRVLQPGHCFSIKTYLLSEETLNCLIDFILVALPVGIIQKLQLPLIQKINLSFIFALGGFVGIISIIRMRLTADNLNFAHRLSSGKWLTVQLGFAVICCCLPTYRPLLPPSAKFRSGIASIYDSVNSLLLRRPTRSYGSTTGITATEGVAGSQRNLYSNLDGERFQHTTYATSQKRERVDDGTKGVYPMHSINVTKSVDIV